MDAAKATKLGLLGILASMAIGCASMGAKSLSNSPIDENVLREVQMQNETEQAPQVAEAAEEITPLRKCELLLELEADYSTYNSSEVKDLKERLANVNSYNNMLRANLECVKRADELGRAVSPCFRTQP